MSGRRFRAHLFRFFKKHGRHTLPWRKTRNPYRILVSEVMLQQTQVERVVPKYNAFLKAFPTVHALARARQSEVVTYWQGLGYNRRAKLLHEAAKTIVSIHDGRVPKEISLLEKLPGVGKYTARAILAFAHNEDVSLIETNIRTVIIHHFFTKEEKVTDEIILEKLAVLAPRGRAREWYAALMDYGSFLKQQGSVAHRQARVYTKQSRFKGSDREVRGVLVRKLTEAPQTRDALIKLFTKERKAQVEKQLSALVHEGFVISRGKRYCLAH